MRLVVLGTLFAAASALSAPAWEAWKAQHGKVYESEVEEQTRFAIFMDNAKEIAAHNLRHSLGLSRFTVKLNEFADQTNEEFRAARLPVVKSARPQSAAAAYHVPGASPPATQDWRTDGWVTPIKDQAQCGSCWAFSATGGLEGQHKNVTGDLISISEQQLVDCDTYCYGCDGGWAEEGYHYWQDVNGANSESDYPYTGQDGSCKTSGKAVVAKVSGYVLVTSGSETALESAVGLVGPTSVAIDASLWSFQFYSSGIYDPSQCSSTRLDHAVLAVGYNADSDGEYWIVKNSWGTSWGQAGYIWMAKDQNNECGIATDASYPIAIA